MSWIFTFELDIKQAGNYALQQTSIVFSGNQ